jgi:subtilisin family serine protease
LEVTKMSVKLVKSIKVVFAVSLMLIMTASLSLAQGQGNVKKIVIFEESFVNEAAQQALVRNFGAENLKTLSIVNGMSVSLPGPAVSALSKRAEVVRIDDNVIVYAIARPSEKPGGGPGGGGGGKKDPPPQPPQIMPWGIDRIDAEYAWATSTGEGVNVAVVDTGIDYTHPDLAGNCAGGINIINPRKSYKDDDKTFSHGTHVAGTIAAENNAIGVVGVAPKASLYGVKVLSGSGSGFLDDIILGIEWCVDNNIQIANMSLGTTANITSLEDACRIAAYDGLIIVAAAGNEYGGPVIYPAAYSSTIAVSATTSSDDLAVFSSVGSQVNIAAPGQSIYSTRLNGEYDTLSGTSMAAPHVAGVLALELSVNITNTNIYATADDIGGTASQFGAGLIDAEQAVANTENGNDLP